MWGHRIVLLSLISALLAPALAGQDDSGKAETKAAPSAAAPADRANLERQLQETLSGAVFEGSYSITGQEDDKPPQKEKYTILRAAKLQGDVWLLTARIQFGKQDAAVPLPLEVKWAGDTPVIRVTDVTIPGLGTFTARVMIYRGRYAGTWQHGEVGGHLWGQITKAETKGEKQAAE